MSKREVPLQGYKFHELLCKSGRIAWAIEDSIHTVLNELNRAGLLGCGRYDDKLDPILQRSFIKMAYADYAPRKLQNWADKAMNENPELIGVLEDDN